VTFSKQFSEPAHECARFRPLLPAILDAEDPDASSVRAHVAECLECAQIASELTRLDAWIAADRTPAPSSDFASATAARMVREVESMRRPRRLFLPIASLAAALLVGVGIVIWQSAGPETVDAPMRAGDRMKLERALRSSGRFFTSAATADLALPFVPTDSLAEVHRWQAAARRASR